MRHKDRSDRRDQALLALNHAIACMVSWPPSDEHLGAAIYFTTLALHRMTQADPDHRALPWAEKYLAQAKDPSKHGRIDVPPKEEP